MEYDQYHRELCEMVTMTPRIIPWVAPGVLYAPHRHDGSESTEASDDSFHGDPQ